MTMTFRSAAIATIALLAGCATTPGEVREAGDKLTFTSANPPAQTARCLARNAEEHSGSIVANERAEPGGAHEVIVRGVAEVQMVLVVADVRPAPPGSSVTMAINHLSVLEPLIERMRRGC